MIVQTDNKKLRDDFVTPAYPAEKLTLNQMPERDAAYATIKAIAENTGKPITAVIADLRNLMMRDA